MSSIKLFPASLTKEKIEEQLREKLTRDLEAAKADIEQRIAELKFMQHEGELSDTIDELDGQLSTLDASLSQVNTASLNSLMLINATFHAKMGATQQATANTSAKATFESAHYFMELTTDKLMAMSVMERAAIDSNHFDSSLASLRGTPYKSYFRSVRSDLEDEREEAKKRGDKVGVAVAQGLILHNTVNSLEKAIELEKDPDRRAELEAKIRDQQKLIEVQEQSIRENLQKEARNQGKAGADAQAHIDQGMADYHQRVNSLKADIPQLSIEQSQQVGLDVVRMRNEELKNRNDRTDEHSTDNQSAVKAVHGEAAMTSNRDVLADALVSQNSEITLTGSALATTSHAKSSTLALSLSPENPIAIAMAGAEQAKEIAKAIPDTKAEADPEKHENVQQPNVPNKVAQAKGQAAASTPS